MSLARCLLLASLTLGRGLLLAAENTQTPGAGASPAAGARKSIFEREPYPAYVAGKRRDPFTFASLPRDEGNGGKRPAPPPERSEALSKAERACLDAEEALLGLGGDASRDYSGVLQACDNAARFLKELQAEAPPEMAERVSRLRATAERLQARDKVEQEFKNLPLEIQGIIWRANRPLALVNKQEVYEGSRVGEATVAEIQPHYVVFLYKGYKIKKGLRR